jgi:D-proline reductase (dithiol) PrdB
MPWPRGRRYGHAMADNDVKALTAEIECPMFEHTAFTMPKPLAASTVAIVTTASLHHADQDDFERGDTTYRVLDGSRRDLRLGHWSPNFDTSGYASDINVVFPIDRLHELAASGRIGNVADQHLSYAGNQFDLSTVRLDSGPAGAAFLKASGVDVVILTPV